MHPVLRGPSGPLLRAMSAVALGAVVTTDVGTASAGAATTQLVSESFSTDASAAMFEPLGRTGLAIRRGMLRGIPPQGPGRSPALVRRGFGPSWQVDTDMRAATDGAAPALVFDYRDAATYSFVRLDTRSGRSGVFQVRSGRTHRVAVIAARLTADRAVALRVRRSANDLTVHVGPTRSALAYAVRADVAAPPVSRLGYGGVGRVAFDNLSITGRTEPAPTAAVPTPNPTPTPSAIPTPTPSVTPSPTSPPEPARQVRVSTSGQLASALTDARPGDVITLADGVYTSSGTTAPIAVGGRRYSGIFVAAARGTADRPIVLRGSAAAVIDGRPGGIGTGSSYGLYLVGADHWRVVGLSVRNVAKGVVLDATDHTRLEGITVSDIGQEGVHLRASSSDNVVIGSTVTRTGLVAPGFGEGIYVGSAVSNWDTYSGGAPDASDRNQIVSNTISRTGAESVDVKEGTSGGLLHGNSFDGAEMSGENYADSWVDIKGNDWRVLDNVGANALLDGFQVHGVATGWGQRTLFRGNVGTVNARGVGFWLQGNVTGTVACDNRVMGADGGISNVRCT